MVLVVYDAIFDGIIRTKQLMRFSAFLRKNVWSQVVSDAEKLVDYPGFFFGNRLILSDELADVALSARKLIGTKHPLIETAKQILHSGNSIIRTSGLIILLVSRLGNVDMQRPDLYSGVCHGQRSLAEITEIIYTANLMHQDVLERSEVAEDYKSLSLGNKMAVLGGDFLLATASTALAKLHNHRVTDSVAKGIADMALADFLDNNQTSFSAEDRKSHSLNQWEKTTFLKSGSLLAESCRSAMEISGATDLCKEAAFNFGSHVSICQTCATEFEVSGSSGMRHMPTRIELADSCYRHGQLALDSLSAFSAEPALDSLQSLTRCMMEQANSGSE